MFYAQNDLVSQSVGILTQLRSKSREVSKPQNTIETLERYATGPPKAEICYRASKWRICYRASK